MAKKQTVLKQVMRSQQILEAFNSLGSYGKDMAARYAVLLLHSIGKKPWEEYAEQAKRDLAVNIESCQTGSMKICTEAKQLLEQMDETIN